MTRRWLEPAWVLIVASLLVGPACRSEGAGRGAAATTSGAEPSASELSAAPVFLENDYVGALREARERKLPLFVDAWAPWCHSCVSMKAFVLKDPALYPVAPKFVWASIDTEQRSSQEFLRTFPMEVWPTLWVIDPATEEPILEWAGAATAQDLATLLQAALQSVEAVDPRVKAAWTNWQAGNRLVAGGKRENAIVAYHRALTDAPADFAARPRLVEALVFHLSKAGQLSQCVEIANREFEQMPKGTSRLNAVLTGLGCLGKLRAAEATDGAALVAGAERPAPADAAMLEAARGRLLGEATRIVASEREPVLADDRSSLFQELVFQQERAGEAGLARTTAASWSAFVDAEAARAPTAAARAVFDYHRMLAYAALGTPERALPMLERSEADFPDDYNPPSRLAKLQLDLGHFDLALAAVERAVRRVYGPRTLRVMKLQADILEAMAQRERAAEVLAQAVRFGEAAGPLSEGYQRLLEDLKQRLH